MGRVCPVEIKVRDAVLCVKMYGLHEEGVSSSPLPTSVT